MKTDTPQAGDPKSNARMARAVTTVMRSAAIAAAALTAGCQTAGSDRLSALTQASNLPSPSEAVLSLAPMLDRITPAVVNLSVEVVTEAELPPVLQDPQVRLQPRTSNAGNRSEARNERG